jgi:hypothetical protein
MEKGTANYQMLYSQLGMAALLRQGGVLGDRMLVPKQGEAVARCPLSAPGASLYLEQLC